MEIRPWTPSDNAALHIATIYAEYGLCFDADFEDDLFDIGRVYAHGRFWVAVEAGQLLATAAVVPNGGVRLIRRMYVARQARRRGLARVLLQKCLDWGDFSRSELWSDVRFRAAHQMYQQAGFVPGHVRVLADPDRSVEKYFWR